MAMTELSAIRAAEFFRLVDAKDVDAIQALMSDDAQGIDEIARRWIRGRSAFDAYWAENLPRLMEVRSSVDDAEVRRWGDVEVETFTLHQSYLFDGTRYQIEAPATMIWRRQGDAWRIALIHTVPLPQVS